MRLINRVTGHGSHTLAPSWAMRSLKKEYMYLLLTLHRVHVSFPTVEMMLGSGIKLTGEDAPVGCQSSLVFQAFLGVGGSAALTIQSAINRGRARPVL